MDRINCRTKSKSATTLQKTLSKATSSGTGLDSNAKLSRPISSKELRVWLAWLIKVVETAEFEWQEWLFSYINFVLKLNESLMKAKQAIEEEERNPNQQLEDCDVARETDSAEAYDVFSIDISCGSDETNYEDMTIRMPTDKNEMDQLIQKFNEEAEKYKSLYEHWLQTANRVNAEIAEKSMMPAEQVNTHEEIPYFVYLKEKTDIDIGIEIDKKEVLESCNGREKITCDNLNLFFNIKN